MRLRASNLPPCFMSDVVILAFAVVTLSHVVTGIWQANSTKVRVSVSKNGAGPPLEVVQVSPTAGYIQTPGWGVLPSHPKHISSVVRVQVPENHTAMVTVLHMNLTGEKGHCDRGHVRLTVFKTYRTRSTPVWDCTTTPPPARRRLSAGSDLAVFFKCWRMAKVGFRLFFSVIEPSSPFPAGPGEDSWNCSVPDFAALKPHFPCDLRAQCLGKEDERECPYYDRELCGLGFVTLGATCLAYERSGRMVTWRENEYVCQRRGMRMASFRTREDYDRLVRYLEPMAAYWGFWKIAVGIHTSWESLPFIWTHDVTSFENACGFIVHNSDDKVYVNYIKVSYCSKRLKKYDVLCEFPSGRGGGTSPPLKISLQPATPNNSSRRRPPLLACPLGHVTRDFLACDVGSACWSRDGKSCPAAPLTPLPPSFACADGLSSVPYTLVCDVRPDCGDGSDESFCEFPPCDLPEPFYCSDRECVPRGAVCDGQRHCHNAVDEDLCSGKATRFTARPPPPAVLQLGRNGRFSVHVMTTSLSVDPNVTAGCPETHFQCPGGGYCMPVFLRCNGVHDCLGKEDEEFCDSYACPGFYRCRLSRVCLHPERLCDRVAQCPRGDDELLCDAACPTSCTCYGLAFRCRRPFRARKFSKVRYLDCGSSGMSADDLSENMLLIYLSLAANGLSTVGDPNFPNLHDLDLSDNRLKRVTLHDLRGLPNLKTLSLAGNPLLSLFQSHRGPDKAEGLGHPAASSPESTDVLASWRGVSQERTGVPSHGKFGLEGGSSPGLSEHPPDNARTTTTTATTTTTLSRTYEGTVVTPSLRALDLSRVQLEVFSTDFLSLLPSLRTVNLSGGGVDTLLGGKGFQAATQLRVLDLRGCPLTHFPRDLLRGLRRLEALYADNYKLCCPATLPADFVAKNCRSPSDEVSSCEALLKSDAYRVCLSAFALLALLGNASSFVYRVFLRARKRLLSFDIFVAYLCVADFLMGVYLAVIGVADRLYRGTYLWEDDAWKASAVCRAAGFLSLVSSEVSALVICLITLDRFLVLRFPFSVFHFGARTAQVASLCVWGVGCVLAATPLTPWAARWNFYSQTGICIPLPISRTRSPGYAYSFGVMIVTNFVLFSLIAAGQASIYWSVRANALSSADTATVRKSQDLTIARRLVTVAMSDFLCWFPIGLASILAATGAPVPGEVNVAMAIFVLPFNSALNPFLYTLNIVLEKRRKGEEERVRKRLMAQFRVLGK